MEHLRVGKGQVEPGATASPAVPSTAVCVGGSSVGPDALLVYLLLTLSVTLSAALGRGLRTLSEPCGCCCPGALAAGLLVEFTLVPGWATV